MQRKAKTPKTGVKYGSRLQAASGPKRGATARQRGAGAARSGEPKGTRSRPGAFRTAREGRLTIYLDEDLARSLRLAAADRAVSTSEMVARTLREAFRSDPPPGYVSSPEREATMPVSAALERARELERSGASHAAIASTLNREGYRTARRRPWNVVSVGRMTRAASREKTK